MRSRFAPFVAVGLAASALSAQPTRPFGTLREQAARQQEWLEQRLTTVLPALMRKHGIDMWVVPMREYNEDPVFTSLVSPTTFAARRRTIYVFFDRARRRTRRDRRCRPSNPARRSPAWSASRLAARRRAGSTRPCDRRAPRPPACAAGRRSCGATQQWQVLKDVVEQRNPKVIGINVSRTFAFSDGLTAGELEGMSEALGIEVDAALQARRGAAARAHRDARRRTRKSSSPSLTKLVRPAHRPDVLERSHQARRDAHERSRLVVAPAGERPRARHLVPALDRRAASAA